MIEQLETIQLLDRGINFLSLIVTYIKSYHQNQIPPDKKLNNGKELLFVVCVG